jgi:hypothetical protein
VGHVEIDALEIDMAAADHPVAEGGEDVEIGVGPDRPDPVVFDLDLQAAGRLAQATEGQSFLGHRLPAATGPNWRGTASEATRS